MTYKVEIKGPGGIVRFEASVPVAESRFANYEGYNIVHLPTDLWAYRNTTGRRFTINGKLVSRNPSEGGANARYLDLIRSWLLPDFGGSGATPPLVYLNAFENSNIWDVQCILKSYSFTFPEDVDWIYDSNPPMPVLMNFSIDIDEAYSAEEITAKMWKIDLGGGGRFVYGGAGGSSGGGVFSTQPAIGGVQTMGGVAITPNISDLSKGGSFGGIASAAIGGIQSLGGLMNNPLSILSNGNMFRTLGVNPSDLISQSISQISQVGNSPFLSGIGGSIQSNVEKMNLNNNVAQLNQNANTFNRDMGLEVNTPTEI